MRDSISNTAEYGDYTRGPALSLTRLRQRCRFARNSICQFAWNLFENQSGKADLLLCVVRKQNTLLRMLAEIYERCLAGRRIRRRGVL